MRGPATVRPSIFRQENVNRRPAVLASAITVSFLGLLLPVLFDVPRRGRRRANGLATASALSH